MWNIAKPAGLPTRPSWSLEALFTVHAFKKPTRMYDVAGQLSETFRDVLHQTAAAAAVFSIENSNVCNANNFINLIKNKIQMIKTSLVS